MKIAIIIPDLRSKSGGARVALEVAHEFMRQGHRVKVYTFRYSRDRTYKYLADGLDIVTFPKGFSIKEQYPLGIAIPGFSTIFAYLNKHRISRALAGLMDGDIDALNPQSGISHLVAHYFNTRVKRLPTVWHMSSLPLLVSPTYGSDASIRSIPLLKKLLFKVIDWWDVRFYWKRIDKIAVLDKKTEELIKRYFKKGVVVNRNGVDADHFRYRPRLPRAGKKVTLLAHSSFFTNRGFEDAIEAVKILWDWGYDPYLIISGDSARYRVFRNYRDRLIALAENLGIRGRVTFPGEVSEEQLLEEFYAVDILVHPHHVQTWGMVVFEAIATGLPVIVSRGAGAHEVLSNGREAMLVGSQKPSAIAEAVKVLVGNPDLYLALSKNGAEFVRREITWAHHVHQILKAIEEAKTSLG